jgi:hypothetical protein
MKFEHDLGVARKLNCADAEQKRWWPVCEGVEREKVGNLTAFHCESAGDEEDLLKPHAKIRRQAYLIPAKVPSSSSQACLEQEVGLISGESSAHGEIFRAL